MADKQALKQEIMTLYIECYRLAVDPMEKAHYINKMAVGVPKRLTKDELVALRDQLVEERDKLRDEQA